MSSQNPFEGDTQYKIELSGTPSSDDGLNPTEPKWLKCDHCTAKERITREPSPGVDELAHDPGCPQRFARSDWWREQFQELRPGYGSPSASAQPEASD